MPQLVFLCINVNGVVGHTITPALLGATLIIVAPNVEQKLTPFRELGLPKGKLNGKRHMRK